MTDKLKGIEPGQRVRVTMQGVTYEGVATLFAATPDHPLGLRNNPEWQASRRTREALYLAERARRNEAESEPFPDGAFAIGAGLCVAICLLSYMIGVLIG